MPAPVRPASSQVPVLFLNPNYQDQYSSPLATPFPSTQSLQRDSPRCFTRNVQPLSPEDLSFALPQPSTPSDLTAMSHSIIPAELQLNKQELHNLVDETLQWCMEGEDDVKEYTTVFWYCCQPLITLGHMSPGECEELYLQGFHPDVRANFPPNFKQQIQDILQSPLPQSTAHSSEAPPAPSPPTSAPSPPVPEVLMPLTDLAASAPALPADPSPVLSPVSDLVALLPPPAPKQPSLVLLPPPLPVCKASSPSSIRAVQPLSTRSQPDSASPPSPVRQTSPPSPAQSRPAAKWIPLAMRLKSLLPTLPTPSQPPASSCPSSALSPPLLSILPLQLPPSTPPLSPTPTLSALPLPPSSPLPPTLPSPLPSPPSTPQAHKLTPPLPSSIAAASPNPSEATEAKPISCQMQEKADISRVRIGDATPITKPEQAQVPQNDHTTPDSDIKTVHSDDNSTDNNDNSIEGKPACDDTGGINDGSNRNHNRSTHLCKDSDFGTSNSGKFVYDPGGHTLNSEDSSMRDDGDSDNDSISISISNEPCAADIHRSHDRDRDKTAVLSPFDTNAVPPVPFAQATSPVLDVTTSCSTDAFPTNAHRTGASVLSFEATDDDEDFAQHARPRCDRCLPARLCIGDFTSTDSARPSAHTRLLGPDFAPAHLTLYLNDEDHTVDNNSNSNADIIDNASTISTTCTRNVNANGSGSNTSDNIASFIDTACALNAAAADSNTSSNNTNVNSSTGIADAAHTPNTNADNDNSKSNKAANIVDADRTISTNSNNNTNTAANRSNSKSNSDSATSNIDSADVVIKSSSSDNNSIITDGFSDANSIVTTARTPSTGDRPDTSNSSSAETALLIHNGTTPTARDNEPKHECVRIPPLNVSPQVPPTAALHPDKPEEPPPAPCTDTAPSVPNLKSRRLHSTHRLCSRPHPTPLSTCLPDDTFTHFGGTLLRFVWPAEDFSDNRQHQ